MRKESASTPRSVSAALSPRSRSSVTNGRRLHVDHVGDTKYSRRFRDVLSEIIGDLGGPDQLSEAQRQLARRAATISLECERLESKAVADEAIDLEVYGQLTDRLGRAFGRLGLKRVAKDITPTLAEYLAEQYPADRLTDAGEASEGNFGSGGGPDRETHSGASLTAAEEPSP